MARHTLHYVTNRAHEGDDRWAPDRYGNKFSDGGSENLRFGKLTVEAAADDVERRFRAKTSAGRGDGESLQRLFARSAKSARISAFRETLKKNVHEERQRTARLGSRQMFEGLRKAMLKHRDVVVYVHGYAVDWEQAVGGALALQSMLNRPGIGYTPEGQTPCGDVLVVLFTWPSDGSNLPFVAYRSDRSEAAPSGAALGRSLLRLRDYLMQLDPDDHCGRNLNLLCHSMGNYVLEHAVTRIGDHVGGGRIPRVLDHAFLCAADVDDDSLEPDRPLGRLHELCNRVGVYANRGDAALHVSDVTKGHPDRLGNDGVARPGELHHKVHQVDCSDVVEGVAEHGYHLAGRINEDIRLSLDGMAPGAPGRDRRPGSHPNVWRMV